MLRGLEQKEQREQLGRQFLCCLGGNGLLFSLRHVTGANKPIARRSSWTWSMRSMPATRLRLRTIVHDQEISSLSVRSNSSIGSFMVAGARVATRSGLEAHFPLISIARQRSCGACY